MLPFERKKNNIKQILKYSGIVDIKDIKKNIFYITHSGFILAMLMSKCCYKQYIFQIFWSLWYSSSCNWNNWDRILKFGSRMISWGFEFLTGCTYPFLIFLNICYFLRMIYFFISLNIVRFLALASFGHILHSHLSDMTPSKCGRTWVGTYGWYQQEIDMKTRSIHDRDMGKKKKEKQESWEQTITINR